MDRFEKIRKLNELLLQDMPQYREQAAFPMERTAQRRLLRSLMNVRPPKPLSPEYLALQDSLLLEERDEKDIVDVKLLPVCAKKPRLFL